MKSKTTIYPIHFREDNTPLVNSDSPVTIVPIGPPKTLSMSDPEIAELAKDSRWLAQDINQNWNDLIPKGANGIANSTPFSKEHWGFVGIQFYDCSQRNQYVPQEHAESLFRNVEGLKGGLERLLSIPIGELQDEIKSLQRQKHSIYNYSMKFKTGAPKKLLSLELTPDGKVRAEKVGIAPWKLVPVGSPLVIEMPYHPSYDIWSDFDEFLQKIAPDFLPQGANAYVSERTVQSPSGIGHLRAVQPYKVLSEDAEVPVAYLERLTRITVTMKGKIDNLHNFTLRNLYDFIDDLNDDNKGC